jgi:hypothetical protein
MTTKAPQLLLDTAHAWEDQYSSAVFAGIVGDLNHPDGYHISYEDNPSGNYSIVRSCDKPPNMAKSLEEYAAAIDMSMSTTDMKTCYNRVLKVYNDSSDPRRKYINAFNGWNGTGDAKRIDFIAKSIGYASPDHKSHCHCEMPRCYLADKLAGQAWLSIFGGQTKEQWIAQTGDIELLPVMDGSTVEDIKAIQYLLVQLDSTKYRKLLNPSNPNDDAGVYNGKYDADMEKAIKQFRIDNGQDADTSGKKVTGWTFKEILWELMKKAARENGTPGPQGIQGVEGKQGEPGDAAVIEENSILRIVTQPPPATPS